MPKLKPGPRNVSSSSSRLDSATYLLDVTSSTSQSQTICFASLAAAGDDRHSNCENSTMSDELNSTENSQVFSVFGTCWICIDLSGFTFGLFAGCYNSH